MNARPATYSYPSDNEYQLPRQVHRFPERVVAGVAAAMARHVGVAPT